MRGSHVPIKRDHFKRKIHQILTCSSFRWIFVFSGLSGHKLPKILLALFQQPLKSNENRLISPRVTIGHATPPLTPNVVFHRRKPSHLGGFAGCRPPQSRRRNQRRPLRFWLSQKKKAAIFFFNKWMFPKIVGFPPKSSILSGFSILNHPFWGTLSFWKHPYMHVSTDPIFNIQAARPTC